MSTTETESAAQGDTSAVITVDLEINSKVLDAAIARLWHVQKAEREQYGRSSTSLSTIAEDILRRWAPGDTQPRKTKATERATCPHCQREYDLYVNGKMRVHGPPGKRCPEYFPRPASERRPLRFPMNRAEYLLIKERIRYYGQSVAHVVTQSLAHFARTGEL